MSALARFFNKQGFVVCGYDKTQTALTDSLTEEGIQIHFEDNGQSSIPTVVKSNKENTLVIYTPAIPKNHQEYLWLIEQGYTIKKRAEVLGMLTHKYKTVAVAGTHGKTTTSSMVAHLLKVAQIPSSAFLGGIATNYNSNLILHDTETEEQVVVAEADEFDRSFLWLQPDLGVITATDADHLDIYGEKDALVKAFGEFAQQINPGGTLFLNYKADEAVKIVPMQPHTTVKIYGSHVGADCRATDIKVEGGTYYFTYEDDSCRLENVELGIPGFHNVENATAAIACALQMGATAPQIYEGLKTYRGVKRRFEYILKEPVVFIDDYAHHPTEIEALITSVKALYANQKITALFQPHLYSRTRDFYEGFASSLSLADEVILTNIYPAREEPLEGVESHIIAERLTVPYKLISYDEVESLIGKENLNILLSIGAGDIDKLVPKLKQILLNKNGNFS